MKPRVLISRPVGPRASDLLRILCSVQILSKTGGGTWPGSALAVLARDAVAMLVSPEDCIDDSLLVRCRRLRIVATTAHEPRHIDVDACTRRGIWVSSPAIARAAGLDLAELDAARNIIDALNGDTPRSAINAVRAMSAA